MFSAKSLKVLACPKGFELLTPRFVVCRRAAHATATPSQQCGMPPTTPTSPLGLDGKSAKMALVRIPSQDLAFSDFLPKSCQWASRIWFLSWMAITQSSGLWQGPTTALSPSMMYQPAARSPRLWASSASRCQGIGSYILGAPYSSFLNDYTTPPPSRGCFGADESR
jgi:hypothetical protein